MFGMEITLILLVLVILIALGIFFYYVPFFLWISARVSGVKISLIQLFLMRIRKVPANIIVRAMIEAHKAGLSDVNRDDLEAHYLAGGNVEKVVHALVSAAKANIDLGFKMATAIDLAGRDVFQAVQMSVNPKVIDTPPVTAVAKDGIQLITKARVTVRANIRQLVGGAGEDTVLARVGEGIVSSIGSSISHKSVLENPDFISRVVLEKGLDAGRSRIRQSRDCLFFAQRPQNKPRQANGVFLDCPQKRKFPVFLARVVIQKTHRLLVIFKFNLCLHQFLLERHAGQYFGVNIGHEYIATTIAAQINSCHSSQPAQISTRSLLPDLRHHGATCRVFLRAKQGYQDPQSHKHHRDFQDELPFRPEFADDFNQVYFRLFLLIYLFHCHNPVTLYC